MYGSYEKDSNGKHMYIGWELNVNYPARKQRKHSSDELLCVYAYWFYYIMRCGLVLRNQMEPHQRRHQQPTKGSNARR